MKIHVATILDEAYSAAARASFERLVTADRVRHHHATDDPRTADAILFVDLHQQPDDPLLRRLRAHRLVRDHPEKVMVYDERDNPFFTLRGLYCSASAPLARRWPIASSPYVFEPNSFDGATISPDLLFSFRGRMSHPVRREISRLRHPRACIEDSTAIDFFGSPEPAHPAAERRYTELLTRSKFVLCPRGAGCSSFRLYETILAGRVPVVISDAWAPPPLIDWGACVIRVPERSVRDLPRQLEQCEEAWPLMVASGARATAEYLTPGVRWNYFAELLAQLLVTAPSRTPWWAQAPLARTSLRAAKIAARRRLRGPTLVPATQRRGA